MSSTVLNVACFLFIFVAVTSAQFWPQFSIWEEEDEREDQEIDTFGTSSKSFLRRTRDFAIRVELYESSFSTVMREFGDYLRALRDDATLTNTKFVISVRMNREDLGQTMEIYLEPEPGKPTWFLQTVTDFVDQLYEALKEIEDFNQEPLEGSIRFYDIIVLKNGTLQDADDRFFATQKRK